MPVATSLFALVVSAGCGGSGQAKVADLGGADDLSASTHDLSMPDLATPSDLAGDMTLGPPTFSGDIFKILQDQACLDCHMTDTWDKGEAKTSAALVTFLTTTKSEECKTLPYVTPGDPANSYLYQKVIGSGNCFVDDPMPDDGPMGNGLDPKDAMRIEMWILEGAPAN
jgi:hypothetical protein